MIGIVDRIVDERGFGFIKTHDGRASYFFHVSALVGLEFDESLVEREVEFDVERSDRGPRAASVRPVRG
jgi:cold shock protein